MCARAYRRIDCSEVEIEVWRPESDLTRHCVSRKQHRLITEPSWLRKNGLVTDVENKPERNHDCGEGARRQSNVGGLKGEAKLAPEAFSEKSLWRFFARLVGEPVLVMRDSSSRMATTMPLSGIACGLPKVKSDMPGSSRRWL
jgi:hypothetical protein